MKVKPAEKAAASAKQRRGMQGKARKPPTGFRIRFRSAGSGLAEASPATYNHFPQISSRKG
jgi:hypothetical protein